MEPLTESLERAPGFPLSTRVCEIAVALAIWITVLPLWLSLAPPVLGAETANCSSSNDANRHQGQKDASSTGERHGAQAVYEAQTLQQCTSPAGIERSASLVFANIEPNPIGVNSIIQSGAGNCRSVNCPAGMRYYSGVGIDSTAPGCSGFQPRAPILTDEGGWTSASHTYRVQHTSNQWQMYVDSTLVRSMSESQICWRPQTASWFAETFDPGDQMGGTPTNPYAISSASRMTAENGAFAATAFNSGAGCTYQGSFGVYHCDVTGSRSLNIWTDR